MNARKKGTSQKERIKKLKELIVYHAKRYHEKDAPEIFDEAYDSLVRELRQLEGATDETRSSETNKVGGSASDAFKKVKHKVRQWSLGNIFNVVELKEWEERLLRHLESQDVRNVKLTFVAEHKLDGLKLVLEYQKGVFVRAATRGDGTLGEDVTHTAKEIKAIPRRLNEPVSLTCVGEVWLSEKEFERINKEREKNDEPLFQNPRNAAAGSLRQLDPSVTRSRNLSIIVYDIDSIDVTGTKIIEPETQSEELALLKKLGLPTNANNKYCQNIEEVIAFYTLWKEKKSDLPYGIDGVVVKVDEVKTQKLLGFTAKAPRFGAAFKFPAVQATTIIEDIQLQVGRTGIVTPVAHLSPTLIAGSTVSRATLHNEDQIKRLDVRVGDTVILQKAGDVIPEIVEVVLPLRPKNTKPYKFPKKVAGCGGDGSIERIPGEAAYRCVTLESDFIHRRRLYYFVSKTALNFDGVGPRIIDMLLDEGLISEAHDLFSLEVGDLIDLPGFKAKAAENVVNAIKAASKTELHRLLIALSIEHVGEETARLIANYCGSIEAVKKASKEELANIHGVGEVVAVSLTSWIKDKKNQKKLEKLLPYLTIVNPDKRKKNTKLSGKTVVFTGTLESLSRDEAKDRARLSGASVVGSVSKNTDYVVVGKEAGVKADKAREFGVTVITEAEFLKMTS